MASLSSVGGVGAGLSSTQIQQQYDVRVAEIQIQSVKDAGGAALALISSALNPGGEGHDLDVRA